MQYQLGLKLTIGPWTDGCLQAADQVTQDNPAFSRGSMGKRKTLFATMTLPWESRDLTF